MDPMAVLGTFGRRLRLGVVGGSSGFIGPVHRTAARLDDLYELVAGAFSSDRERGLAAARAAGVSETRAYPNVEAMIAAERGRPDGIDVVAIMTPNAHHAPAALAALEAGLDVICDKPLTTNLADAVTIVRKVRETGCVFCLAYNYGADPMVGQARAMVRAGEIGEVRQIHLAYVQGHNASLAHADTAGGPGRLVPHPLDPALRPRAVGAPAH